MTYLSQNFSVFSSFILKRFLMVFLSKNACRHTCRHLLGYMSTGICRAVSADCRQSVWNLLRMSAETRQKLYRLSTICRQSVGSVEILSCIWPKFLDVEMTIEQVIQSDLYLIWIEWIYYYALRFKLLFGRKIKRDIKPSFIIKSPFDKNF